MIKTGIRWESYSLSSPEFNVRGYTEKGKSYQEDAVKALRTISKISGKPIPQDIELEAESISQ